MDVPYDHACAFLCAPIPQLLHRAHTRRGTPSWDPPLYASQLIVTHQRIYAPTRSHDDQTSGHKSSPWPQDYFYGTPCACPIHTNTDRVTNRLRTNVYQQPCSSGVCPRKGMQRADSKSFWHSLKAGGKT